MTTSSKTEPFQELDHMHDRPHVAFVLAFSLAVLGFFPYMAHPGTRFFYGSVLLLLFLAICFESNLTFRRVASLPLALPLIAIVVVSTIYVFHSAYPYQSQQKWVRLLIGVLMYVVAAFVAKGHRGRSILLWAVFGGGTLLSIHALWLQSTGYTELLSQLRRNPTYDATMQRELIRTLEAGRALGRFGNPNQLAGYLILVLWCGVLLWEVCRDQWQRVLIVVGGMIQVFCIYQTYSRSGLLALLFSAAVLGFWLVGRVSPFLRKILVWGTAVGIFAVVLLLVAFGGQLLGGRLTTTSTILARLHFFRQALSLIGDYFPDGTGLESFRYLATRYIRLGELESLYPHNIYLGAAVESGVLGLFAYFWLTIVGLRWWRRPADMRSVVGWGSFATFILLSCIDFHNEVAEILLLFVAIQGIGDSPYAREKEKTAFLPIGKLAVVVLSSGLWWFVVLCPYMAEKHQQLGLDQAAVGQPGVKHLRQAMAWAPRDAEIANNLGRALRTVPSTDSREEGLEFLRKATKLNPYQAYFHGDLAEALFDEGRTKEALEANERAHEMFPKKSLYIRRKAKYMLALGKRDEWKQLIERAEKMEQRDEELRP